MSYVDKLDLDQDDFALAFHSAKTVMDFKKHRSPSLSQEQSESPGLLDVWEDEESKEEELPPFLLNVPLLEGPLAFKPAALKSWGRAHIDNSERSIQFRTQL